MYGVDILLDNAKACRDRLYEIWEQEYHAVCKKECNDETRASARFILERNIICGNALTLFCVDDEQQDTRNRLFSLNGFPFNVQNPTQNYTFAELVNAEEPKKKKEEAQQTLFDLYPEPEQEEGIFLQQYITQYRRLVKMANGLFDNVYNPDVLSCLANLSNDEVFASRDSESDVGYAPQDLFAIRYHFPDPACKTESSRNCKD